MNVLSRLDGRTKEKVAKAFKVFMGRRSKCLRWMKFKTFHSKRLKCSGRTKREQIERLERISILQKNEKGVLYY